MLPVLKATALQMSQFDGGCFHHLRVSKKPPTVKKQDKEMISSKAFPFEGKVAKISDF